MAYGVRRLSADVDVTLALPPEKEVDSGAGSVAPDRCFREPNHGAAPPGRTVYASRYHQEDPSRRLQRLRLLGFLALFALSANAQELFDFTFVPPAPMPGATVKIHVVTPPTSCPLLSTGAEVRGSVITVAYVEGCACLPGLPFPLELTEEVGPLPPGRYVVQLERSQVEHDGTLCVEPQVIGEAQLLVSGEDLGLHGGRFVARATWRTFDGSSGVGRAAALSDRSGYFWFFHPSNAELTVKVLNGCRVNGHFWVFVAAASNVEYEVEIHDIADDSVETWTGSNPLGRSPSLEADIRAFATCP